MNWAKHTALWPIKITDDCDLSTTVQPLNKRMINTEIKADIYDGWMNERAYQKP